MITADTITDEQMQKLNWSGDLSKEDYFVGIGLIRLLDGGARMKRIRARCAELLNERERGNTATPPPVEDEDA